MHFMDRDDIRRLWDELEQPLTYYRFSYRLLELHRAEQVALLERVKREAIGAPVNKARELQLDAIERIKTEYEGGRDEA